MATALRRSPLCLWTGEGGHGLALLTLKKSRVCLL
jgi:hypothetical protein